jgi:hypothetical protein
MRDKIAFGGTDDQTAGSHVMDFQTRRNRA